ncbi:DNA internalization-related competence protein ComEC/Rec2 [Vibrio panuliri]|nr:DNA internalization-related competence protein ComEC/Rec2 [Vibrio panuliri]KAB1454095.1 DNA internalization-related competence protein ComEC/Rec2 [Vibrio panuliri]
MTLFVNYWTLSSFAILIITTPHWFAIPEWFWSVPCLVWLLLCLKFRWLRWGCGLIVALLFITVSGNRVHHQMNTLFNAGLDSTIIAEVDSLFKPISHGFQGIAVVRSINGEEISALYRPRIYLTAPISLELGDRVVATVSLKPIIGTLNQVGFDQEKYAIGQRVVGRASIKTKYSWRVHSHSSLRQKLFDKAVWLTRDLSQQGLLLALGFGERHYLSAVDWQRLQHSGLSHLIAISGLHVGIAFGFGWWVAFCLFRLGVRWIWAAPLLALAFATGYAWLAGFSIPTQRALVLLVILLLFRALGVHSSYRYKWLLMVAAVLAFDPFAAYSSGFYLSALAVAAVFLLLSISQHWRVTWQRLLFIQVGLIILMAPAIVLLFHGFGFGSFFYNALFVPWFSYVVIPITLSGVALSYLPLVGDAMFALADFCLTPLSMALPSSQHFWLPMSLSMTKLLTALMALWLIRRLLNPKTVSLLVCVTLFHFASQSRNDGWRFTVLDVGHGLSVVIEKNQQAVVYDTGMRWAKGSYAQSVIVPYLHAQGLSLDTIIISHFDSDHAGGVDELLAYYPNAKLITSQQRVRATQPVLPCIRGEHWHWQGLTFEVLWPPQMVRRAYNPHSCVVRISSAEQKGSVLLTGDIEAIAEWMLVREPEALRSEVVIVPHHGSKTSSMSKFVSAVDADIAIASNAFRGRWNLPNESVRQRYLRQGAVWFDTGQAGQVNGRFSSDRGGQNLHITTMRSVKGEPWYRQMLRKRVE